MSKLLIDEPPLQVLPRLAVAVGLYEAIILQQIHYWLEINKRSNRNFRNGHFWTYNSYKGWQEQFPFMATITVRRAINSLRKQKLIVTENFNVNKFDNTLWYRINYKRLASLELVSGALEHTENTKEKDGEIINLITSSDLRDHTYVDDEIRIPKDHLYDKICLDYAIHRGTKRKRKPLDCRGISSQDAVGKVSI